MEQFPYQMQYTKFPCNLYGTFFDSDTGKVYDDILEGVADGVPHMHAEMELLYILLGEAVVEVDGESYSLHTKDLLIINPFESHRLLYTSQQTKYGHYRIRFRLSMLMEGKDTEIAEVITCLEQGALKCRRCFSSADSMYEKLRLDFKMIYDLCDSHPSGWEFGLKGSCYMLIFDLIHSGCLAQSGKTINTRFSDTVVAYVESHCTEDISVADAAEALGYNKSYFCRLFHETMRISFTDYLHLVRINLARKRMADGVTDISSLATEVGYNSPSYFSKLFHRYIGETPTSFCRRVQTGNRTWNSVAPTDQESEK